MNWKRAKDAWSEPESDLTARVLARPGTPSRRMWPLQRRPMRRRSTRDSCPTRTRAISSFTAGIHELVSAICSCKFSVVMNLSPQLGISFGQCNRQSADVENGERAGFWKLGAGIGWVCMDFRCQTGFRVVIVAPREPPKNPSFRWCQCLFGAGDRLVRNCLPNGERRGGRGSGGESGEC